MHVSRKPFFSYPIRIDLSFQAGQGKKSLWGAIMGRRKGAARREGRKKGGGGNTVRNAF